MNRNVLLIGLAVILPFLGLLFFALGKDPTRIRSPLIGKAAPEFTLRDVTTGEIVSLESARGKPMVVNFWATWCVPCYAEHPYLVAAARQYGDQVLFVGVVYEDEEEAINRFLRQYGRSYPALQDQDGRAAIAYGVYGVPETFFIDGKGQIVAKHEGPLDQATLQQYLGQIGVKS
ncbi:MAG TPA: DsbE family thiol:disulfide interchange protein [Thermoanaerobaculia bacterium]|nr:DsbE family thiol:disulfide interchange protein [Thermoanaerobaculia bacterium]